VFCPRCGHLQVSEEVRYCSRCGFDLTVVRASLTGALTSVEPAQPDRPAPPARLRHVNLGVILMLLGTMLTSGIVARTRFGLTEAAFIVVNIFLLLLVFARPIVRAFARLAGADESQTGDLPARRKEMSYGVSFMLLGTMLATFAALAVRGPLGNPAFFSVLFAVFALLLFTSHRIARAVQALLTDDAARPTRDTVAPLAQAGVDATARALPPVQSIPASIFGGPQTTAEMVAPPSVTERTTSLLEKE
jgi:hypothetical protein